MSCHVIGFSRPFHEVDFFLPSPEAQLVISVNKVSTVSPSSPMAYIVDDPPRHVFCVSMTRRRGAGHQDLRPSRWAGVRPSPCRGTCRRRSSGTPAYSRRGSALPPHGTVRVRCRISTTERNTRTHSQRNDRTDRGAHGHNPWTQLCST